MPFEFYTSMLLWIPVNVKSEESSDDLNQKVTASNGAIFDFTEQIISLDEMLQTIEYYGASVDEYLDDLAETVRIFGA